MSFLLKRFSYLEDKTFGRLYYNDKYVCDTLEGVDMLLEDRLPDVITILKNNENKFIAIPRGGYTISNLKVKSSEIFPVLYGVYWFDFVHITNVENCNNGCICVGVYDYENKMFINGLNKLQNIINILKENGETKFVVR